MEFRRKTFFFKLFALLICYSCSKNTSINPNTDEKTIIFSKTYGGSLNESAQAITKTQDGGYAILGYTQSLDGDVENKITNAFDFWLLKFNPTDELQWQRTYGGANDDRGNDLISTNDGGFALLGYNKSNDGDTSENFGNNDFWLLKLNNQGDITWEKSFGFSGLDFGTKIIQTSDNGYLLVGTLDVTASNGQGNSKSNRSKRHAGGDFWAIKLDTNGTTEWTRFFGGSFTDIAYDVVETTNNNFLIVGSSDSEDIDITNNKGSYDFWVLKISNNGNLIWEKSFGGSQIDEAWGIVTTNDGNYIIVGDTRSNDKDIISNNGAADIFILKIDTNGNLIWRKNYGGTNFDTSRAIHKTQDGGFLVSGNSRSSDGNIKENKGQNDALVLKIDNNGNLKWLKTLGGSNTDFAFDAIELDDGSIIAVGDSTSNDGDITENKGFNDALIFKLN